MLWLPSDWPFIQISQTFAVFRDEYHGPKRRQHAKRYACQWLAVTIARTKQGNRDAFQEVLGLLSKKEKYTEIKVNHSIQTTLAHS